MAPTQWSIVEQGSGTTDDRGTSVDYGLFWSETRAGTVLVAALVKRDAPPAARAAVQRLVSSIQIVEPPGDRAGMRRDLSGRAVYGRGEEEGDDGRAGDKDNADDENEEEDVAMTRRALSAAVTIAALTILATRTPAAAQPASAWDDPRLTAWSKDYLAGHRDDVLRSVEKDLRGHSPHPFARWVWLKTLLSTVSEGACSFCSARRSAGG